MRKRSIITGMGSTLSTTPAGASLAAAPGSGWSPGAQAASTSAAAKAGFLEVLMVGVGSWVVRFAGGDGDGRGAERPGRRVTLRLRIF
ncbi:MAG: hypothetical protein AMXMBFR53_44810 [Gemmatimonadota bacterium]